MTTERTARLVSVTVALLSGMAIGASQDNNVEWNGLSHVGWHERRPLCPLDGESFDVLFQVYRDDLTGARVWVSTDGTDQYINATLDAQGPIYDTWRATVPATPDDTLLYRIEVTDGTSIAHIAQEGPAATLQEGTPWTIDYTTLSHAPVGATPVPTGTVFRVWAPGATSAHVRGDFNAWSLNNPMTADGEYFTTFVPGARGGQEYKFFFNNNLWKADPRSRALNQFDSGNSVIFNPLAYTWASDDFVMPPVDELVVYQLHVGSFAGFNDPIGATPNPSRFIDVVNRIDHLVELGVNCVYLNPVFEFPGSFSGGYNPTSMWAFESALGTPANFQRMVDELHQAGIGVILDIVWNHVSPTDNFLWNYDGTQTYFDTPAVETPWGSQFDFDKQEIKDYLVDSVVSAMGEFRLDGYRVDAMFEMVYNSQGADGQEIIRAMNDLADRRYADHFMVAEIYDQSATNVLPTRSGGFGFDSQYHPSYREALRDAIFSAAFNASDMSRLAGEMQTSNGAVVASKGFNYLELHDETWATNGNQRAVRTIDTTAPHDDAFAKGRTKVGYGILLLSRGVPAILQGTEFLEDRGFEERLDWSHKTTYGGILEYYQDLIGLRTTKPALFANSQLWAYHVNDTANVMAFERTSPEDGRSYVAVVNLSNTDIPSYDIGLPRSGEWGVVINSEATKYEGDGFGTTGSFNTTASPLHGFNQRTTLALPGHGLMLLQHNPEFIDLCTADYDGNFVVNINDLLGFLADYFVGSLDADLDGSGAVSINDLLFFLAAYFVGC